MVCHDFVVASSDGFRSCFLWMRCRVRRNWLRNTCQPADPEHAYERRWALSLLEEVMSTLRMQWKSERLVGLRAHQLSISALAFSPDSRWLPTGSNDATLKAWPVGVFAQSED